MNPQLILQAFAWYIAFLISTTLHEASHAFAALKLGDPTAYQGGQVTLDPVPHIRKEPFGMLIIPLVSFFLGGWMFGWGSAPYDPYWALNHPKKSGWMAMAGPGANLFLVLLTGIIIRIGLSTGLFTAPESISFTEVVLTANNSLNGAAMFLSIMFSLNLILFCFNLLPVPPLDGSAVLPVFLTRSNARRYVEIMHNSNYSFIGLIIAWNVFDVVFSPIHVWSLNILYLGITVYG